MQPPRWDRSSTVLLSCVPILLVWGSSKVPSSVLSGELSGFSATVIVCYCVHCSPGHEELERETRVLYIWNNKSWPTPATDLSAVPCISQLHIATPECLRQVTDRGERFLYLVVFKVQGPRLRDARDG